MCRRRCVGLLWKVSRKPSLRFEVWGSGLWIGNGKGIMRRKAWKEIFLGYIYKQVDDWNWDESFLFAIWVFL